jgi:hypothetical protein
MSLKTGEKPFHRRTLGLLAQYTVILMALFGVWWFFGRFYLVIGIVLVSALTVFIVVIERKAAKNPVNIEQGNWRKHLETLLYRGYDRAAMMVEAPDAKRLMQFANSLFIVEAPATERYMQFTKCITDTGVTIQLQFPRAPWSLQYYDEVQELLKQGEYYYKIWPVRPEDKFAPEIDQFIVVYLERDLQQAIILTKLILLEIFKLKPSDTALVWFGNVSADKNKKIGF